MNRQFPLLICIIASLCICVGGAADRVVGALPPGPQQREPIVQYHASGPFEVKMTPQTLEEPVADSGIGRMMLDKQYHGDIEATGKGQMLAFGSPQKGSAGYVAMERVAGTLGGRSGSFALQHSGTLNRGAQQLSITVVPDSGTGQLTGLAGTMKIIIEGGKHSYAFDYTLPEAARPE